MPIKIENPPRYFPTRTMTTGASDAVDVGGINTLFLDCSSGTVTIGAFTGGIDGQVLHIVKIGASANNAKIEHDEGTPNQNIFLHAGGDETLSSEFGGWILVCHEGIDWHDASHSKHV